MKLNIIGCLNFQEPGVEVAMLSLHWRYVITLDKMISWAHGLLRAINSLQLSPDKCDVITTSSAAMNI